MPLPYVNVPQGPERCWRKLGVFSPEETGLTGLTLFLDLDLVLLDSIDCFFDYSGEFIIIRDWLRDGKKGALLAIHRFFVLMRQNIMQFSKVSTPTRKISPRIIVAIRIG